jgi:phosphoglycerate dehydrogenase-like enzyme
MRITPTGFLFEWTVSCPDSWCLRACRGNIRASKQDLAKRAPNLALVHHLMAGVSNVRQPAPGIVPDFWGAPGVSLTTTRGANSALPIAEYALGAIFMAAKSFERAVLDREAGALSTVEPGGYQPVLVRGKTMGIVGLGGIGQELAGLGRAVGMRVLASRRSVVTRQTNAQGVDVLLPPAGLQELLAESDFVVLCVQWTAETESIMGAVEFEAMRPSAVFVNVSRGEHSIALASQALLLLPAASPVAAGQGRGTAFELYSCRAA